MKVSGAIRPNSDAFGTANAKGSSGPSAANLNNRGDSDGPGLAGRIRYNVTIPLEIGEGIAKRASNIAEGLDMPISMAAAVMQHHQWNPERLMEEATTSFSKVLGMCGRSLAQRAAAEEVAKAQEQDAPRACGICFDDTTEGEALACGHWFCNDCWSGYLRSQVTDIHRGIIHTTCMGRVRQTAEEVAAEEERALEEAAARARAREEAASLALARQLQAEETNKSKEKGGRGGGKGKSSFGKSSQFSDAFKSKATNASATETKSSSTSTSTSSASSSSAEPVETKTPTRRSLQPKEIKCPCLVPYGMFARLLPVDAPPTPSTSTSTSTSLTVPAAGSASTGASSSSPPSFFETPDGWRLRAAYRGWVLDSYVEAETRLRWCPNPRCPETESVRQFTQARLATILANNAKFDEDQDVKVVKPKKGVGSSKEAVGGFDLESGVPSVKENGKNSNTDEADGDGDGFGDGKEEELDLDDWGDFEGDDGAGGDASDNEVIGNADVNGVDTGGSGDVDEVRLPDSAPTLNGMYSHVNFKRSSSQNSTASRDAASGGALSPQKRLLHKVRRSMHLKNMRTALGMSVEDARKLTLDDLLFLHMLGPFNRVTDSVTSFVEVPPTLNVTATRIAHALGFSGRPSAKEEAKMSTTKMVSTLVDPFARLVDPMTGPSLSRSYSNASNTGSPLPSSSSSSSYSSASTPLPAVTSWLKLPDYAVSPCIVEDAEGNLGVATVKCICEEEFCFKCSTAPHVPAPCDIARRWRTTLNSDDATRLWLESKTKPCPKCKVPIEKNRACNHMVCAKCQFSFCWLCLEAWDRHNEYYVCTEFNAGTASAGMSATAAIEAANLKMQKYSFYSTRFHNHQRALQFVASQKSALERSLSKAAKGWHSLTIAKAEAEAAHLESLMAESEASSLSTSSSTSTSTSSPSSSSSPYNHHADMSDASGGGVGAGLSGPRMAVLLNASSAHQAASATGAAGGDIFTTVATGASSSSSSSSSKDAQGLLSADSSSDMFNMYHFVLRAFDEIEKARVALSWVWVTAYYMAETPSESQAQTRLLFQAQAEMLVRTTERLHDALENTKFDLVALARQRAGIVDGTAAIEKARTSICTDMRLGRYDDILMHEAQVDSFGQTGNEAWNCPYCPGHIVPAGKQFCNRCEGCRKHGEPECRVCSDPNSH